MQRHRPTTACATCRDRRVKCGRERPICSRCAKADRSCVYKVQDPPKYKFVSDSLSRRSGSSEAVSSSSGTWNSVIKQQEDLVKIATPSNGSAYIPLHLWTLVEPPTPIPPDHPSAAGGPRASFIKISALGESFMCSIRSNLPSPGVNRLFLDSFLLNIHPIVPVCNTATLRDEYAEFWENFTDDTSLESLVRILAIIYTGGASTKGFKSDPQISSLLALYEEIMREVDFSAYGVTILSPRYSVQFLQGYLIMNTFRVSQLAPFSAFGFLPQAIRFAQSLRLHFNKDTGSGIEPEVKRRIWWHLIFLDVESTVSDGLQGIIRPDGYTTQLPSFLREEVALMDSNIIQSTNVNQKISPMMVAMQGHWQLASRMQSWFERMPVQDEVVTFSRDMHQLLSLIEDDARADWPRTYIRMQIHRAYCMLGLRFWQLGQFKGTDCQSEVVRTARSFLENYLHLATLSAESSFSWFVPGFVQPIHALMILLTHLSTCTAIDGESFLSRALVEKTMDLRMKRILSGNIIPFRDMIAPGERRPDKANPRYHSLWILSLQVWEKNGWAHPEKAQWSIQQGCPTEFATALGVDATGLSNGMAQINDGVNHDLFFAPIENMLTGELLDPLNWDEWESLSAGFFTT